MVDKDINYIKFYILCRIEKNKLTITKKNSKLMAELNKLFSQTKIPARSTIHKWITDNGETKDNIMKTLTFDDYNFKELDFRVDLTKSNLIRAIQFFSLCRLVR